MKLPIAVLAGGLATRLGSITTRLPKSLVEVAGRPFAEHQIELLREHGLDDIVFLVGHLGDMIQDVLGDGSRWGVRLRYVFDGPARRGTGGAVRQALEFLGDSFFVLYGDSYLECDYQQIATEFSRSGRGGLMTVCRNDNQWDRSNVRFEGGRILEYDKSRRSSEMHHIDYGLGAFRRHAFAGAWPEAFDLADVYQQLLNRGDLAGVEVPSRFFEIGSVDGLQDTRVHLQGKESSGR